MASRAALKLMGITKERILQVGLGLIEEIGLENFTIEAVAERCHIRTASLHKYFSDADDFQDALTAGALARLIDAHRDFTFDRVGRDGLETYALAERSYAQARPALYAAALRAARGQGAELRLLRQTYMAIAVRVLRGYGVQNALAPEIASCLSAAVQGFAYAEITGRGRIGPESDRNYERLLDMLDAGARAARTSPVRQPPELVAQQY